MGPALCVAAVALMGVPLTLDTRVRDAAFLVIGIGIGTGVDAQAQAAFLRWPIAFAALAVLLVLILLISRFLLSRVFGFDRRGAVLASTPGHLSYVLSLGAEIHADLTRIVVVQSVRILAMTVAVPFLLIAMGFDVSSGISRAGEVMSWGHFSVLLVLGLAVGLLFQRIRVPAAMLIAGMAASSVGHLSEMTPGQLDPVLALLGYVTIGTLIGSRFTGITLAHLRAAALAGVVTTGVALGLAAGFAVPVAAFLGIPVAHVLVAFAPGGLDTMLAMGAMLGADPGFVAASHVGRLLILTALVPLFIARAGKPATE